MSYIKSLLLVFLLACILNSCTEKIELDLVNNKLNSLIVEGGITTDTSSHEVLLSLTSSYFSNVMSPAAENATVSISDGSNSYPLTEISSGVYQTSPDVFGVIGKTYTLNIELEDGRKYTASETIKEVGNIDSIACIYGYDEFNHRAETKGYSVFFWAQEPATELDHYLWSFYVDGVLDNDTLREAVVQSDEMINGVYIDGARLHYIDEKNVLNNSFELKVEMFSISKEYYEFIFALLMETDYSGGMYSGPPANIPSNVIGLDDDDDAFGYFTASDLSTYTITVNKTP